ncbi:MAG: serine/threonine-protein kinase [Gaiellales bacterium]
MSQPARQIGRYVVVREIGRGGMAAVYLARQVDLDRDVALKELNAFHAADPAFAERFVRESRMAGSMNHPNIVTVYEFLTEGSVPYIAMEYLERGSLRPYVGGTTLAQTIGVLEGALAGLAQAERREIVHRDIKPENLMVTMDGEVKIADFGIAKALTEAGGPNLTATGSTVGTPAYMAPEQATAGEVGPWTDLYSIGIMAYEMTVGRVPFHEAETPVTVMLRHVNDEIPPAASVDPSVDGRLSDWIDRLLVKDPRGRTQNARAAWYELEEIAVAVLGPLWRRAARLDVAGAGSAAAPLTPAPFGGDTPPTEPAAAEYLTYAGRSREATPPPPVPSPTPPPAPPAPTPPPVEAPVPPARPAEAPEVATGPERTVAPAVPVSIETFESEGAGGRGRGLAIGAALLVVALVAGLGVWIAGRGSGKTTNPPPPPPPAMPKVTAQPSRIHQGFVGSVAPYQGHAWGIRMGGKEIVDVDQPSRKPIPVGTNTVGLADAGGALWASSGTSGHGQVRRVTPGRSPETGSPIPFTGVPAHLRAVVADGTIWQPIKNGLLKIPEQGGQAVPVSGITFTPRSLEFIAGAIWVTDGKATLFRVPVTGAPTAKPYPVPGAGWITGSAKALYITTTTGVSTMDPRHPSPPKPVPFLQPAPTRIALIGDILWMTFYTPSGTSMAGSLVGIDLKNQRRTTPATFKAPAGGYPTKLVDVNNTFWMTVLTADNKPGLEPFRITGG